MSAANLAAFLVAAGPQPPIASYDDLGAAIGACIRGDAPVAGSEVELRFTLTARGTIVGKPMVVIARSAASMAAQRAVVATVFEALRRCTPFVLAPAFGQSMAGRPVTLHVSTGRSAAVVI